MKRFVTYLYQYEGGQREKSAGFIKTDIRDSGCRMEIHIRGLERFQGKAKVYLILPGEQAIGFDAGELPISQGSGHLLLTYPHNLLGDSGFTVNQVQAVALRYDGNKMLLSCWTDNVPKDVLLGKFLIPETMQPDNPALPTQEAAPSDNPAIPTQETVLSDNMSVDSQDSISSENSERPSPEMESASPVQTQELKSSPEPQISYRKIEITDIRKLPKRNWYLCSNSFLIHGFFNYHYLMLKTIEQDGQKICFLGVPGVFEQAERMMALLFGFPEFEPAQVAGENDSPDSASQSDRPTQQLTSSGGVFGYWMCKLEL